MLVWYNDLRYCDYSVGGSSIVNLKSNCHLKAVPSVFPILLTTFNLHSILYMTLFGHSTKDTKILGSTVYMSGCTYRIDMKTKPLLTTKRL